MCRLRDLTINDNVCDLDSDGVSPESMTNMSTHEKKPRPPRSSNPPSSQHSHHKPPPSSSSSIATPPRAALRFKTTDTSPPSNSSTQTSQTGEPNTANESDDARSFFTQELSLSSLLTEKDGRIAELEKELRVMVDEFEKELTGLSLKLTAESEVAMFWQQKHASLTQMGEKYDAEIRVLRREVASSLSSLNTNQHEGGNPGAKGERQEKAREEKERDIKTRITSLLLDRDAFREAYNEAMGELKAKDEEVRELRGQIRGLKAWVSVSGKTTEQVADESFGERWRMLGNGLQNWVISGFRKVKIDLDKADSSAREQLSQLVPTYASLASSSKIHLIQAIVSRLLVDHIFSAYFAGLSTEYADSLRHMEVYLRTFGTSASLNTWRSTTLSILHKSSQSLPNIQTLCNTVLTALSRLLLSITNPPLLPSPDRDASFLLLLNSAISLSHLLRCQKAAFEPLFPRIETYQRTLFEVKEMDDVGGGAEEEADGEVEGGGREVEFVVFPGLVKWGDEMGERGELRNVVARVRVLCAPD